MKKRIELAYNRHDQGYEIISKTLEDGREDPEEDITWEVEVTGLRLDIAQATIRGMRMTQ